MRYAILLLSSLLWGCAGQSAAPEPSAQNPTSKVEAEAEETEATNPQTDTSRYTRSVETPWGHGEIFDPVQDPEFVREFKDFRGIHHENEDAFWKTYNDKYGARIYADYAALGCGRIQDMKCGYHSGQTSMSPAHIMVLSCPMKRDPAYQNIRDLDQAMQSFTQTRCMVWNLEHKSELPSRRIETPWGDQQIPDYRESTVLRWAYDTLKKSKTLSGTEKKRFDDYLTLSATNNWINTKELFKQDILDLGCTALVTGDCQPYQYQRLRFCPKSSCTPDEIEIRYEFMPPRAIVVPSCVLNGEPHESQKIFDNVQDALDHNYKYQCSDWRDEAPVQD